MGVQAKKSVTGRGSFTIRLPRECDAWLYELAAKNETTLTDVVTTLVNEARTWWGMGEPVVEQLKKDAAALSLSEADYLRYLLFSRFRVITEKGPGFDKKNPDVLLSQRR